MLKKSKLNNCVSEFLDKLPQNVAVAELSLIEISQLSLSKLEKLIYQSLNLFGIIRWDWAILPLEINKSTFFSTLMKAFGFIRYILFYRDFILFKYHLVVPEKIQYLTSKCFYFPQCLLSLWGDSFKIVLLPMKLLDQGVHSKVS